MDGLTGQPGKFTGLGCSVGSQRSYWFWLECNDQTQILKMRRKSSNLYLRRCRVSEAPAERPEVRPEEAHRRCQASASDKVCLHVCVHYKQA